MPPAFLIISQTWKPLAKTRHVPTSDIPNMDNLSHVSPNTGLQKLHTYPGLSSVKTFWTIYFVVKIIQYISVIQLLKQLWKMCFCAIQSGSHRRKLVEKQPLYCIMWMAFGLFLLPWRMIRPWSAGFGSKLRFLPLDFHHPHRENFLSSWGKWAFLTLKNLLGWLSSSLSPSLRSFPLSKV